MARNPVWALALSAGFLANAGYCVYLLQKSRTWSVLTQKDIPATYWPGAMLMGIVWFFGIAAYGMGAPTGEWKGASPRTYGYSWVGIAVLLIAIYVISRGGTS